VVRTTVGTIAEAELSVQESEKVTTISADQTATVTSSSISTTNVLAPSGTIISVIGIRFQVSAPSGATSGNHQVQIQGPNGTVRFIFARANFGDQILIDDGIVKLASSTVAPASEAVQSNNISSLTADDSQPITFRYANGTDADQTNTRQIDIVAVQRGVSK